MLNHDPENAPNPKDWLELDKQQRLRMIELYLDREGGYGGSLQRQASIHAIVETQLAESITPVKAAFMRLRDNGVSRHEAVRTIGSILADCMPQAVRSGDVGAALNKEYLAKLEVLTADTRLERSREKS